MGRKEHKYRKKGVVVLAAGVSLIAFAFLVLPAIMGSGFSLGG
nr:hypothetical protein 18 [bacterium]